MQETFLMNGNSCGHTKPYSSRELELTQQCTHHSSLVSVLSLADLNVLLKLLQQSSLLSLSGQSLILVVFLFSTFVIVHWLVLVSGSEFQYSHLYPVIKHS